jgi:hypothetical protein
MTTHASDTHDATNPDSTTSAESQAAIEALGYLMAHPIEAARALAEVPAKELGAFIRTLEQAASVHPLEAIECTARMSAAQLARALGISRQAYAKWKVRGVPVARLADVARLRTELEQGADLLTERVKRTLKRD